MCNKKLRIRKCVTPCYISLHLFLLYLSVIALKNNVPEEIYELFLMLLVASRIVSSPSLVKMLDYDPICQLR